MFLKNWQICLISDTLTHFQPIFQLWINEIVGFYYFGFNIFNKMFENTCGTVTFQVEMRVIDLHLYLRCLSSTGVFQTFW